MQHMKRILCYILSALMLLSALPMSVFATEGTSAASSAQATAREITYADLYVKDGLLGWFDGFSVKAGETVTEDKLGNSLVLSGTSAVGDGYVEGRLSFAEGTTATAILPGLQGLDRDVSIEATFSPTTSAENTYAFYFGFDRFRINQNTEGLQFRHDFSSWRVQSGDTISKETASDGNSYAKVYQTQYYTNLSNSTLSAAADVFKYGAAYIGMYGKTDVNMLDAGGGKYTLSNTHKEILTLSHSIYDVHVGNGNYYPKQFAKDQVLYDPNISELLTSSHAKYPYQKAAEYTANVYDAETQTVVSRTLPLVQDYIAFQGYYSFATYVNNVEQTGIQPSKTKLSLAYNTSASLEGTPNPGVNYGRAVSAGAPNGTTRLYSLRVYDHTLTEAERLQNRFADIAAYYGLDLSAYADCDPQTRAAIHEAFREEKIQVYTDAETEAKEAEKAALQALLDAEAETVAPLSLYVQDGLVFFMDFSEATASETLAGIDTENTAKSASNRFQGVYTAYEKFTRVGWDTYPPKTVGSVSPTGAWFFQNHYWTYDPAGYPQGTENVESKTPPTVSSARKTASNATGANYLSANYGQITIENLKTFVSPDLTYQTVTDTSGVITEVQVTFGSSCMVYTKSGSTYVGKLSGSDTASVTLDTSTLNDNSVLDYTYLQGQTVSYYTQTSKLTTLTEDTWLYAKTVMTSTDFYRQDGNWIGNFVYASALKDGYLYLGAGSAFQKFNASTTSNLYNTLILHSGKDQEVQGYTVDITFRPKDFLNGTSYHNKQAFYVGQRYSFYKDGTRFALTGGLLSSDHFVLGGVDDVQSLAFVYDFTEKEVITDSSKYSVTSSSGALFTFDMHMYGISEATGLLTKSYVGQTAQLDNMLSIGAQIACDLYNFRIYTKQLTSAEFAQNHLADLILAYDMPMVSEYASLSVSRKRQIAAGFHNYQLGMDATEDAETIAEMKAAFAQAVEDASKTALAEQLQESAVYQNCPKALRAALTELYTSADTALAAELSLAAFDLGDYFYRASSAQQEAAASLIDVDTLLALETPQAREAYVNALIQPLRTQDYRDLYVQDGLYFGVDYFDIYENDPATEYDADKYYYGSGDFSTKNHLTADNLQAWVNGGAKLYYNATYGLRRAATADGTGYEDYPDRDVTYEFLLSSTQQGSQAFQLHEFRMGASGSAHNFSVTSMTKWKANDASVYGYSTTLGNMMPSSQNSLGTVESTYADTLTDTMFAFTWILDKTPAASLTEETKPSEATLVTEGNSTLLEIPIVAADDAADGTSLTMPTAGTGAKDASGNEIPYRFDGITKASALVNGKTQYAASAMYYRNVSGSHALNTGSEMTVYAARTYLRALSEAEQAQNHFADLVGWYQLELSVYGQLSDANKALVHTAMAEVQFADPAYATHNDVQTLLDAVAFQYLDWEQVRAALTADRAGNAETVESICTDKLDYRAYAALDAELSALVDIAYAAELAAASTSITDRVSAQAYLDRCVAFYDISMEKAEDETNAAAILLFAPLYEKGMTVAMSSLEASGISFQSHFDDLVTILAYIDTEKYSQLLSEQKEELLLVLTESFSVGMFSPLNAETVNAWFDRQLTATVFDVLSLYAKPEHLLYFTSFYHATEANTPADSADWLTALNSTSFALKGEGLFTGVSTGYTLLTDAEGAPVPYTVDTNTYYELTAASDLLKFGNGYLHLDWKHFTERDTTGTLDASSKFTHDHDPEKFYSRSDSDYYNTYAPNLDMKTQPITEDHSYQFVMELDRSSYEEENGISYSAQTFQIDFSRPSFNLKNDGNLNFSIMHRSFNTTTQAWDWSSVAASDTNDMPVQGKAFTLTRILDYVTDVKSDDADLPYYSAGGVETKGLVNEYDYANNSLMAKLEEGHHTGVGSMTKILLGGHAKLYAIRQYDILLTDADIAQNRVADMLLYYGVDLADYFTLSEEDQASVRKKIQTDVDQKDLGDFGLTDAAFAVIYQNAIEEVKLSVYYPLYAQRENMVLFIDFTRAQETVLDTEGNWIGGTSPLEGSSNYTNNAYTAEARFNGANANFTGGSTDNPKPVFQINNAAWGIVPSRAKNFNGGTAKILSPWRYQNFYYVVDFERGSSINAETFPTVSPGTSNKPETNPTNTTIANLKTYVDTTLTKVDSLEKVTTLADPAVGAWYYDATAKTVTVHFSNTIPSSATALIAAKKGTNIITDYSYLRDQVRTYQVSGTFDTASVAPTTQLYEVVEVTDVTSIYSANGQWTVNYEASTIRDKYIQLGANSRFTFNEYFTDLFADRDADDTTLSNPGYTMEATVRVKSGSTKMYTGLRFDKIFNATSQYDINTHGIQASFGDAGVAHSIALVYDLSNKTGTYGSNAAGTLDLELYSDGSEKADVDGIAATQSNDMMVVGGGSSADVYLIRLYRVQLTAEEIQQNHFVDVAKHYRLNLSSFLTLPESMRAQCYALFDGEYLDEDESKAARLQSVLDVKIAEIYEANNDLLDAYELLSFQGFSGRVRSYNGIRSVYYVDEALLAKLEESYTVEFGTAFALKQASDGTERIMKQVQVQYDAEGNLIPTLGQMILTPIYKTGAEPTVAGNATGYLGKYEAGTDDNGIPVGKNRFVCTLTYKGTGSQTKDAYESDVLYRAYLALTDLATGEVQYIYVDSIPSFTGGDAISMLDLASYFYQNDKDYTMMQKVMGVCGTLPLTEMTLNGNDISLYTLVCRDEAQMSAWNTLRDAIATATGYRLPIAGSAVNGGYTISYEDTYDTLGIATYGIKLSGNAITLYGSRTEGLWYNIHELTDAIAAKPSALTVEAAEKTTENLRVEGKTYAMDQFFDANGKLLADQKATASIAYGDGPIAPAAEEDDLVVVFTGASNTEGGWIYMEMICEYLSSYFGRRVVYYNAGVGGTTSNLTAARTAALMRYAPDIVFLDENSNDTGDGTNTKQYSYNESVLYQMQSWAKIPVVIFNEIPRADTPDSEQLSKTNLMLDYKREIMDYYGVNFIVPYDYLLMQWETVQKDLAVNGTASVYISTYNTNYFAQSPWKEYDYFKTTGEAYKKLNSDTPSMDFLTYLACYGNPKDGTTATWVNYNVHPHNNGYLLIGEAMEYYMSGDMVAYLSNAIQPKDYELLHATNANASSRYNMIGADGTAYLADGTVSTREITYKVGDTVYAYADRLTNNDFANANSQWSFWTGKTETTEGGETVNNWFIPSSFDTAVWNGEMLRNSIGKGSYFNTKPYTKEYVAAIRSDWETLTDEQLKLVNRLTETINHYGGYMANGVAQMYFNASDRANGAAAPEASFSFTSSADAFALYVLSSDFMGTLSVSVTNAEGTEVKNYSQVLGYTSKHATAYGRLLGFLDLPGDGAEYTVTVTVDAPTSSAYLYRFGYIIERIDAN